MRLLCPRPHDLSPREARVIYESRDGNRNKTFDAREWLAAMCSHVPNKGKQMIGYYGYYRNVCRGKRKAKGEDDSLPTVLHPDDASSAPSRKEWARMIQKIYEVDPLTCPKCNRAMRILALHRGSGRDPKDLSYLKRYKMLGTLATEVKESVAQLEAVKQAVREWADRNKIPLEVFSDPVAIPQDCSK